MKVQKLKWKLKRDTYYTNGFEIIERGKKYKAKNYLLTNKNMEIGWFDKLKDAKICAKIIHNG